MGSQLRRPYGRTHGKDGVAVNLLVDGGRHPEALLALEDGSYFFGRSAGAEGETFGEVVFNTSMVGYQEIVSDPSYAGQLVTLTYPQVGNYGINEIDMQSRELALAGLIVHDMCYQPSNWQSVKSLPGFLAERGIVAIEDVDTRALTLRIREGGAMKAAISTTDLDPASLVARVQASAAIADHNYVADVSCKKPYVIPAKGECRHKVVAYDCGEKAGIAKRLAAVGCEVTVVPWDTPAEKALALSTAARSGRSTTVAPRPARPCAGRDRRSAPTASSSPTAPETPRPSRPWSRPSAPAWASFRSLASAWATRSSPLPPAARWRSSHTATTAATSR